MLAWSCAGSIPDHDVLCKIQDAAMHCMDWCSREHRLNAHRMGYAEHMLTIAWASSFAHCLTGRFVSFLHAHVREIGCTLDAEVHPDAAAQGVGANAKPEASRLRSEDCGVLANNRFDSWFCVTWRHLARTLMLHWICTTGLCFTSLLDGKCMMGFCRTRCLAALSCAWNLLRQCLGDHC